MQTGFNETGLVLVHYGIGSNNLIGLFFILFVYNIDGEEVNS